MSHSRSHLNPQPDLNEHGNVSLDHPQDERSNGLHSWMMTLCLILMGGAVLFVLWRGQTGGSLLLLLPMLLCLGIHFFLHRHAHHPHDE